MPSDGWKKEDPRQSMRCLSKVRTLIFMIIMIYAESYIQKS